MLLARTRSSSCVVTARQHADMVWRRVGQGCFRPWKRMLSSNNFYFKPKLPYPALIKEIEEYNKKQHELLQIMKLMYEQNVQLTDGKSSRAELNRHGLFERTVPVLELPDPLPRGIDARLASAVLRRGTLNAESHPWLIAYVMTAKEEYKPDDSERDLHVRWHGKWRYDVAQDLLRKKQLKYGDVVDVDHRNDSESLNVPYSKEIPAHFANSPSHTDMRLEGTHVALGFNDLLVLLSAADLSTDAAPLHFVGYERSVFSVAKSSVIACMLQNGSVSALQILQVWYSSIWSQDTVKAFREACEMALKNNTSKAIDNPRMQHQEKQIASYLQHWMQAEPIQAQIARKRWFVESTQSNSSRAYTDICSFHREEDRTALMHYFMTGEFGVAASHDDTNVVGSLTMWNPPDTAGIAEGHYYQDRVCHTIFLEEVLEEFDATDGRESVIELVLLRRLRQVSRLKELVQSDRVKIDVRWGDLKPMSDESGHDLVQEIFKLQPNTMSWSNLVDYFCQQEFHVLAQSLSRERGGTVHYGYSMNWPTSMYGASILDYQKLMERQYVIDETLGDKMVEKATENGTTKLLSVPFHEHAILSVDNMLGNMLKPAWIAYFQRKAQEGLGAKGFKINLLQDYIPAAWPVARSGRTIFLQWKYDRITGE